MTTAIISPNPTFGNKTEGTDIAGASEVAAAVTKFEKGKLTA